MDTFYNFYTSDLGETITQGDILLIEGEDDIHEMMKREFSVAKGVVNLTYTCDIVNEKNTSLIIAPVYKMEYLIRQLIITISNRVPKRVKHPSHPHQTVGACSPFGLGEGLF